jgi:DNA-binding transcriptional LysR family regulator
MNVVHLRYARAVAREQSFSRAARALSVTQPALSNGIAVLERTLGGRLFHRTTRGVTPTPLGERVLPLIETTLQGLDAVLVEARLANRPEPRPLRVGVTSLINRDLIGRVFEVAHTAGPGHDIVLRTASIDELLRGLSEADLDLLLMPAVEPGAQLRRTVIGREPMVFVDTAATAGADRPTSPIDLRETTATPLILPVDACGLTRFTRKAFADAEVALATYAGEAHDCRVLQDWVVLGLGSAILPASKVNDGTRARPVHVDDIPLAITYEACWLATSAIHTQLALIASILANPLEQGAALSDAAVAARR